MVFKPPAGSGRGAASVSERGAGVGIGIGAERVRMVFKPPPGAGGGSERSDGPARAPKREGRGRTGASGGRGGERVAGMHTAQNVSGRNAPPFLRGTSKKGAAGRTQSAAERLSSYDNIDTYPLSLWRVWGRGPINPP